MLSVQQGVASPASRLGGYLLDAFYSFMGAIGVALVSGDAAAVLLLPVMIIVYVLIGLYFWTKGTSPGKASLGLYVVDERTGARAGFWTMLLRETIGKWLSGLVFGLGYLWILFDGEHQGWHDKLVRTVVIRTGS